MPKRSRKTRKPLHTVCFPVSESDYWVYLALKQRQLQLEAVTGIPLPLSELVLALLKDALKDNYKPDTAADIAKVAENSTKYAGVSGVVHVKLSGETAWLNDLVVAAANSAYIAGSSNVTPSDMLRALAMAAVFQNTGMVDSILRLAKLGGYKESK